MSKKTSCFVQENKLNSSRKQVKLMNKTNCFANPPAGDAHFTAARWDCELSQDASETNFQAEVLFFTIIPTESLLTTERSLTGRENREMGVKRKRLIVSRQPIFY